MTDSLRQTLIDASLAQQESDEAAADLALAKVAAFLRSEAADLRRPDPTVIDVNYSRLSAANALESRADKITEAREKPGT